MHGKVRVYHDMIIKSPKFVPKLLLSRYAVAAFGFMKIGNCFLALLIFSHSRYFTWILRKVVEYMMQMEQFQIPSETPCIAPKVLGMIQILAVEFEK